jgi:hypothetical protein
MLAADSIPTPSKEEDHVAVSRREFLKTGTMVSLSAVIPLNSVVSVFGQASGSEQMGLFKVPAESQADERLTEENFSRYLNSRFRVYTSPLTAINLELINVKHLDSTSTKHAAKTAKLDSFSVLFRGPRTTALESRTYRINHDQMGTFEVFISPVNDRKKERLYEAVFNRLRS